MPKAIEPSFFERPADKVAKDLLGKAIIKLMPDGQTLTYIINETEAYLGEKDKANHARKGLTARTKVMYGEAGVWYVYLVYGMHYMLNVVTEKEGCPHAVLIRGAFGVSGPGRLSKLLQVDKSFNGLHLAPENKLYIADTGFDMAKYKIEKAPRIGIDYAEEWKDKKLRFVLKEKNHVA